jgi:hypothetical protein
LDHEYGVQIDVRTAQAYIKFMWCLNIASEV